MSRIWIFSLLVVVVLLLQTPTETEATPDVHRSSVRAQGYHGQYNSRWNSYGRRRRCCRRRRCQGTTNCVMIGSHCACVHETQFIMAGANPDLNVPTVLTI